MSISRDTETVGTAFTTTGAAAAISHAGSASARAACVLIDQNGTATDEVSGVTYGGVAMSRVRSDSEATEAGRTYIYWLDNIPTGTQNVVVTTTAGTNKQAVVATMLVASGKVVLVAGSATGTSASVANPSWTISGLTASSVLMAYEVIHSGLTTMTTTPASGWTLISSTDLGAQGRGFARQAVASSGTTLTCGWTASTADDFVGSSVAFIESDAIVDIDSAVGSTSSSWSHTNSAAGNAIIVAAKDGNSGNNVTAVSYGGVALSKLGFAGSHNGTDGVVLWGKIGGLPTGSNTVSVTGFSEWAGSASYVNAGSFGSLFSNFNTSAGGDNTGNVVVTGTTTNSRCVAATAFGSQGTPSATSPATQRWFELVNSNSASGNGWLEDQLSAGGGASTTITWTNLNTDWWGTAGIEIIIASPGDSGTGSIAMHKMGLSGIATAPLQGTGSIGMKKMGLSGIATAPLLASGAVNMHKMSLAASGKEIDAATGSIAMHKMGILASGSVGVTDIGTGSIAMHKMSLSATGKEVDAGTGSLSMHKMGLSATGRAPVVGTGSIGMHKPSLSATGKEVDAGTGSIGMKKMGLSGSGTFHIPGSGSIAMHKMAVHITGIVGTFIVGTGSARMKKMGLSGSGQETLLGTGSIRMHKMSVAGLAAIILPGSGSIRMHKMGLSGSAKIVIAGSGSVRMHKMVPHGTMADLGTGSIGMKKMGLQAAGVSKFHASSLFIFTAV